MFVFCRKYKVLYALEKSFLENMMEVDITEPPKAQRVLNTSYLELFYLADDSGHMYCNCCDYSSHIYLLTLVFVYDCLSALLALHKA